ncbi:AIR carboxylase family protein [Candidatus Uhrbacteria bacterium]|nr:AIR carboxylase family protein [Candidatus Uhrbacteria bacterium]
MSKLYTRGEKIAEGKTKRICRLIWNGDDKPDPSMVVIQHKDDITAGDGAKHFIPKGKGAVSGATNDKVFDLLIRCGLPVAFEFTHASSTEFVARKCAMYPLEVVVRRKAMGSYLKRNPHVPKGALFPRLEAEFYLKTKDKEWRGAKIAKDDPLIRFTETGAELFHPGEPLALQAPFMTLTEELAPAEHRQQMEEIAIKAFLALEKAWSLLGAELIDFKVEFGLDTAGNLLLADVIDADSWRVLKEGDHLDKQPFREGEPASKTLARYRRVKELTDQFQVPKQQVLLFMASERDDAAPFLKSLAHYGFLEDDRNHMIRRIIGSAHKQPEQVLDALFKTVQECPDCVIIAAAGRSNGLGPVLAANTAAPVITVPLNYADFPNDIWSSLRLPSQVPLQTLMPISAVLDPANAVLAAMRILAQRSPWLYMRLGMDVNSRRKNPLI